MTKEQFDNLRVGDKAEGTRMINWNVSRRDAETISKIADRILADLSTPDDKMTIVMDLTACHANGVELRLAELLAADKFDLSHDYYGIRRHLNRTTGILEGCFLPRYAA